MLWITKSVVLAAQPLRSAQGSKRLYCYLSHICTDLLSFSLADKRTVGTYRANLAKKQEEAGAMMSEMESARLGYLDGSIGDGAMLEI